MPLFVSGGAAGAWATAPRPINTRKTANAAIRRSLLIDTAVSPAPTDAWLHTPARADTALLSRHRLERHSGSPNARMAIYPAALNVITGIVIRREIVSSRSVGGLIVNCPVPAKAKIARLRMAVD
jgi:hypothetical protein